MVAILTSLLWCYCQYKFRLFVAYWPLLRSMVVRKCAQYVTTLSSSSLLKPGCENMRRSPYFLVSLQGSEEVVFHGKEGRRGPRGDGNLVVDVLGMLVDGLLGDDEELGDLLLGMPTGEQSQDLHFALAEPGHQCSTGRAHAVTCSGKHAARSFTVESSCTDLA